MSPADALAHLPRPAFTLPALAAGPYLAEARRRFERLKVVDFTLPLSRRRAPFADRWAEAQRWRLAEAWKSTQAGAQAFERQLRAAAASAGRCLPAAPQSLDSLRAALLTQYCAHILEFQASQGKRPGAPARPVPLEWMQLAAAAAVLAVVQTALMLWVLHRPTRRRPVRRRPAHRRAGLALSVRLSPTLSALNLPLRL